MAYPTVVTMYTMQQESNQSSTLTPLWSQTVYTMQQESNPAVVTMYNTMQQESNQSSTSCGLPRCGHNVYNATGK